MISEVLVIGAGPAGLMLGCELARRGVACRVVDKAPRLFIGSRAKGLQPRTLEVFEDVGVLDAIREGGARFPPFRLYRGKSVVWERSLEDMLGLPKEAQVESDQIPFRRPWLIPQWRTDRILRDRFVALGGRLDLGTELVRLETSDAGVRATLVRDGVEEAADASYLIGADGGRSAVRKLSGFSFEGESDEVERTLIGDVRASGLEGEACHILTSEGDVTSRFSLWNLPRSEHYQFVATVPADETSDLGLASVQALLERRTGRDDIRLSDLRWISLYRVSVRMVDNLRKGSIFLVGDAAHVHSSAGGQGLNTAIQDAYNLGWKLAAVVGGACASLLDTYDEERLPVATHVLGLSSRLHQSNFRPTAGGPPSIHQLDISYRGSSLGLDDGGAENQLRAGDRAPDGKLADGRRLFDVFRGTHWTLLAFGDGPAPSLRGCRVERVDRPLGGYDLGDRRFILVRPDGHICAISASPDRITAHLERVGLASSLG